jgi:hypothetical protein
MKNVFYFYKSTLSINLSLSVLFGGFENKCYNFLISNQIITFCVIKK